MAFRAVNTTHVRGAEELRKKMRELPGRLGVNVLRSGLRAGAKLLRDAARARAPKKTGNLRDSITYHESEEGVNKQYEKLQRIFAGARYAHLVEFGHMTKNGGHVPANPFMRDSFAAQKDAMVRKLEEKVKQRLNEIIGAGE